MKAAEFVTVRQKMQSLRAQLNHIWMPIMRCGSKMSELDDFKVAKTETLLCWYGRSFCYNRIANKCFSKLDALQDTLSKLHEERKELLSPCLKRVARGSFSAAHGQHPNWEFQNG